MAIYHCTIKIIGRSGGKSAVASAAYRSGEKLYDERIGLTHDFTKKHGVVFTEVSLPAHAPPEYADRNALWNAVEKAERNSNAQLAREIEVALPKELSRECQIEIVRRYPDVQAFMRTFREMESVVEQYNRDLAEWERQVSRKPTATAKAQYRPPEKQSVLKHLREIQERNKQKPPQRQRKKSFDRDSR